jgi:hypothetical protein
MRSGNWCSVSTTVLLFVLCCWVKTTSFGQGIVDFENFNNSLISTSGGPTTGLISGPVGTYYFTLLSAPTSQTTVNNSLTGWDLASSYGYNTTTPGLMNGNITTDPGTLVLGWGPGEAANFLIVGWSANIGTSYGAATAWWNNGNPNAGPSGYFGISDIAQDVLVGGNPFPVPTIFGPTPGGEVQGFTLNYYSVPEPSTLALGGLGSAVLLAFSRRRLSGSDGSRSNFYPFNS